MIHFCWPFKVDPSNIYELSSCSPGQFTASVFSGCYADAPLQPSLQGLLHEVVPTWQHIPPPPPVFGIFFSYKISGFWLVKWAFRWCLFGVLLILRYLWWHPKPCAVDFWSSSEFPTGKPLDLVINRFTRFDCFGLVEHMQIPQKWKDATIMCSLKAYIHLLGSNHPRNITAPWGQ